jgi:hypothetical protein
LIDSGVEPGHETIPSIRVTTMTRQINSHVSQETNVEAF